MLMDRIKVIRGDFRKEVEAGVTVSQNYHEYSLPGFHVVGSHF